MGTKSKFFRALVAGQTIIDGRKIDDVSIDQIVETFNTETYTPRINVEHLSGYSPDRANGLVNWNAPGTCK